MIFLLVILLLLSLTANGILVWYSKQLNGTIFELLRRVDEFQKYLEGYCKNLESIYELPDFYGDQTIKGAVEDTRTVIDNCTLFKATILGEDIKENTENETEQ